MLSTTLQTLHTGDLRLHVDLRPPLPSPGPERVALAKLLALRERLRQLLPLGLREEGGTHGAEEAQGAEGDDGAGGEV